jgi:hypothetical protein
MDKTVQTNVRVAQSDRALIVTLAQRLRNDSGFREQVKTLLDDGGSGGLSDRVRKLEQQVGWLLSGATVMPHSTPRLATPPGNSARR